MKIVARFRPWLRLALALLLLVPMAAAAPRPKVPVLGFPLEGGAGTTMSVQMQIVILLTALTLLPALIMSATPLLRILIVLHFLRQALGTQGTPSNQVLIGLGLFLMVVIMQPVAADVYAKGWEPFDKGQLSPAQAFEEGARPFKAFLARFAREKDVRLFLEVSRSPAPRNPQELDLKILIPAYILSELKAGFQIGAVLFLPFLIIDITVASVTLSIGMIQLPPAMVSAPFKILLFVLVDGWNLLVGSLVKSFF